VTLKASSRIYATRATSSLSLHPKLIIYRTYLSSSGHYMSCYSLSDIALELMYTAIVLCEVVVVVVYKVNKQEC